jgi:AcrR family transcriptional regulator
MSRGRPRKLNPNDVLDSAMRLFWEKGYDATSMNDLVSTTGMAKPGLYANFGDKEELYTKALDYYFNTLGKPIIDDLVHSTDPTEVVIKRLLDNITRFVIDKSNPTGCFVVNSMVECANKPKALEELARRFDAERRKAFVTRFQNAAKNNELPTNADPEALAEFFAAQILALAVMGRGGANQENLDRFINIAMSVLKKT